MLGFEITEDDVLPVLQSNTVNPEFLSLFNLDDRDLNGIADKAICSLFKEDRKRISNAANFQDAEGLDMATIRAQEEIRKVFMEKGVIL